MSKFTSLRLVSLLAVAALASSWHMASASVASPTLVSGSTPFTTPGCNGAPQTGTNYPNAEVEPWVAVNPTNSNNIAGTWQQDRWSNGGANGLVAGVTTNGGTSWTQVVVPKITACSGGTGLNAYERASDPWITFAPNGDLYHISLSFNDSNTTSAVLVSKSTNGGLTWGDPVTLLRNTEVTVFNDKESITADPTNANYVYAVWDRLEFPQIQASPRAAEHALGYHGPTFFARTTDGGATWEPARPIFDPGGVNQTIGNQIVVLPDGTLVNVMNLVHNFKNAHKSRGFNVAILRSTDNGASWSKETLVNNLLSVGISDPETGAPVRTGDIIPDIAVDRNSGALYVVWQDSRFSGGARDGIAFSKSTDGGQTWSAPVQINKVPGVQAFTASVEVAGNGNIGVTYYDFRNNTSDPSLPTDYWFLRSTDGGATWSEEHVAGPFDMTTAPFALGYFVGDYEGLATAGNDFIPFFVQANSGNTSNRTDVFATRVTP